MKYWREVPTDLVENLEWRLRVRRSASDSVSIQSKLMQACRDDVLFWLNGFCWVFEPRPRVSNGRTLPTQLPFIAWDHQVPVIEQLRAELGWRDIGVEKSRGEGMSWIGILLALHDFLFQPMSAVGLVSSTEKKTDNPDNPDSLFWKLDWELTKLPRWMSGVLDADYTRNRSEHVLKNLHNGSTLVGFSATAGVGRGGRYRWFMMDELGEWDRGKDSKAMTSTNQATDSRLVVSTPYGSDGAYYEFMHKPSNALRLKIHWTENPTKNRGLYRYSRGELVELLADSPLPDGYREEAVEILDRLRRKGFKLEETIRSPWYDNQCDRPDATPTSIAQELDLDYGGSQYRIYGHDFFEKAEASVCTPLSVGDIEYNPETLEGSFDAMKNGPVKLWCELNMRGCPPRSRYVFGADVCAGLGGRYSSNSALEGFDAVTLEQVFEFASNTIEPSDFADLSIAVCKLFHGAHLVWEENGPGKFFTQQVITRQYGNVYFRTVASRRSKKKTKNLGWWTGPQTREIMFGDYGRFVRKRGLVLRSDALVRESKEYVRIGGKIVHILASGTDDDSSKGEAHGDRVVGACMAVQGLAGDMIAPEVKAKAKERADRPERGTMAYRVWLSQQRLSPRGDEWDERSVVDMVSRG